MKAGRLVIVTFDGLRMRCRFPMSSHKVQIRVKVAPVIFKRVVVHFGNGTDEELQFAERINAGGSTRPLDLRGTDRFIKSVEFWYEKARWGEQRPAVELYGR